MEITAEEMQYFGLIERDLIEIFSTFTPIGLWRIDLDSGHKFCCRSYCKLFGLTYTPGPVNMIELTSHIHPEDLSNVMASQEAASVQRMSYQKVHRATADGINYRYICSIGRFREKPGTSGEIIGVAYEVPPHRCEFRYETETPSA
ncbi:PAS domain-containing protein [Rhizobium sp. FY34]|uniref:PAS domain-containing protein n=1 Tax=Rhizobium sp. FY34 TaxID=2562309 RepID=UPI0010C1335E|nr:PAS domain-containing protein [Rhizobium sp. FY34]